MRNKHHPLLAAVALCCFGVRAHADAALELMVKKGLVSRAEADAAEAQVRQTPPAPAAAPPPGSTPPAWVHTAAGSIASEVIFSGCFQGRYTGIIQHEREAGAPDPASTNGFTARRVFLNFDIRLRDGWSLLVTPEMDGSPNPASGNTASFYLDRAEARYTAAAGVASVGLRNVNFGCEVNEPSKSAPAVERSAASQHLANNNLAARHIGVYWDGQLKDTGLFYGGALTNASVNSTAPTAANNEFATWANAGCRFGGRPDAPLATLGLNGGYIGEMAAVSTFATADSAAGLNPYATFAEGRLFCRAEIIAWHITYAGHTRDENLLGLNLTTACKITDDIEPVVRLSCLDAGSTGITNNGAVHGAHLNHAHYGKVRAIYLGVNHALYGTALRIQSGYEFSRLSDSTPTATAIDAHALRVQLQVAF